jgi:hypothetical protein
MATVDVSFLHARACHIERGIRLDLAPIALFSLDFLVIPSNLGFRVQILKKYRYFEWIDVYVQRLKLQESIGGIGERNLGGGYLL